MGALTGLSSDPPRPWPCRGGPAVRWQWAAAVPALWALGWAVTTLGQIHVEEQFTIFGAYGAADVLRAVRTAAPLFCFPNPASDIQAPEHAQVEATA